MEESRFQVRLATEFELLGVMWLIRQVVFDMNKNGMYHWNLYYPNEDIIKKDIENHNLYMIKVKGVCIGIIVLNQIQVEEYNNLNWEFPLDKTLVIHRLAILPGHSDQNVRAELLDFAEIKAKEMGLNAIRVDAFSGNFIELDEFSKKGFSSKGDMLFKYQTIPFKGFEKKI